MAGKGSGGDHGACPLLALSGLWAGRDLLQEKQGPQGAPAPQELTPKSLEVTQGKENPVSCPTEDSTIGCGTLVSGPLKQRPCSWGLVPSRMVPPAPLSRLC